MPKAVGVYKECAKCRSVKHVDEFYRDGRTKDGFTYYCKPCRIEETQKNQPTNTVLRQQLEQAETVSNWFKARLPMILTDKLLAEIHNLLAEETGFTMGWSIPETTEYDYRHDLVPEPDPEPLPQRSNTGSHAVTNLTYDEWMATNPLEGLVTGDE